MAATVVFVVIGTLWPVHAALAYTSGEKLVRSSSTPEAALRNLGDDIRTKNWQKAYDSLANKGQFTVDDFRRDLNGSYQNLRSYADLGEVELRPIHQSGDDAEYQMKLHWTTVVGDAANTRDVHVVRNGNEWQVQWPIQKEAAVPPQVIPVNYLRWDVIYRGAGDDWGAADVEAPHVRIVDMHPLQRAEGLFLMGELLNEDVVPAYVSITATLLDKKQQPLGTETSFDKIQHLLLPKQVTPFLIRFPDAQLSQVGGVRMTPFSQLVSASADPVIAIQNEKLNPAPDASLSGELVNQSGQVANVAHVLSTFYDKSGNLVWVADQYVDRALAPQTPVPFVIRVPQDLAKNVSSDRTIISSYSVGGGE
jgi:hypothetical protein